MAQLKHGPPAPEPADRRAAESIVNFEIGLSQLNCMTITEIMIVRGLRVDLRVYPFRFLYRINDLFGDSVTPKPFNPIVFNIYDRGKVCMARYQRATSRCGARPEFVQF
jgi:hypothetical protein